MKQLHRLIVAFIVFPFVFPSTLLAGHHKVFRIVDEKTIVVNYNGKHEKVRLLCVNIPESVNRDKKQNVPMGKVASKYTKHRLNGKYVDLEFEEVPRRWYHQKFLVYVFVNGENFNKSKKLAVIVATRKELLIAHAVYKSETEFSSAKVRNNYVKNIFKKESLGA